MQLSPLLFKNNLVTKKRLKKIPNFINFYRSTVSLDFILKSIIEKNNLKNLKIAIPSLYCRSTINYLKLNNKDINIIYYDIAINSDIDLNRINEHILYDVIIIVHYFYKHNIIYDRNKYIKRFIIEDCTHLIDINKINNDNIDVKLFSPYKFFPIPLLGLCVVNKKNAWLIDFYNRRRSNYKIEEILYKINIFFFHLKEDLRFIFKQLLLAFYKKNRVKEINFNDEQSEVIPLNIIKPSNLSKFLYSTLFFKKNNLYEIHNKNLLIINRLLELINNEWQVYKDEKSFLCRIKIINNKYELKLINELINLGIPFLKWPDINFDLEAIKKYPKSYYDYIHHIYLPINTSNNKSSIKKTIIKVINKYIGTYKYQIYNYDSIKDHFIICIKLIKTNKFSTFIKIIFKADFHKQLISILDINFKGNSQIIKYERNLIFLKCLKIIKSVGFKNYKINTSINEINKNLELIL